MVGYDVDPLGLRNRQVECQHGNSIRRRRPEWMVLIVTAFADTLGMKRVTKRSNAEAKGRISYSTPLK